MVETVPVKIGRVSFPILAVGRVESEKETLVKAKVDGVIDQIPFEVGDRVAKGKEIIYFDKRVLIEQLHQAEDRLRLAEVELGEAEDVLKISKELYQIGVESKHQIQINKNRLDRARIQKELAEKEIKKIRLELSMLIMLAPHSGVVIEKYVEEEESVTSGQPLIRLADLERLEILAKIDEINAPLVKVNQDTVVTTVNGVKFMGYVAKISPIAVVEENSTFVEITIKLKERGNLVKIGNQVDVEIITEIKEHVLTLPSRVIRGGREVFVYENGVAKLRMIKTGLSDFNQTEIIEGLKEGEEVIISNSNDKWLRDGVRVIKRRAIRE